MATLNEHGNFMFLRVAGTFVLLPVVGHLMIRLLP